MDILWRLHLVDMGWARSTIANYAAQPLFKKWFTTSHNIVVRTDYSASVLILERNLNRGAGAHMETVYSSGASHFFANYTTLHKLARLLGRKISHTAQEETFVFYYFSQFCLLCSSQQFVPGIISWFLCVPQLRETRDDFYCASRSYCVQSNFI